MTIARLGKDDPRRALWEQMFGRNAVPVEKSEPNVCVLPGGDEMLAYFVDFSACHQNLIQRMRAVNLMMGGGPELDAMLAVPIFPIRADGVTVIEATESFWKSSQCA